MCGKYKYHYSKLGKNKQRDEIELVFIILLGMCISGLNNCQTSKVKIPNNNQSFPSLVVW